MALPFMGHMALPLLGHTTPPCIGSMTRRPLSACLWGQADLLGDMEGAASLADALECGAAFRVLQTLVSNWLLSALQYSSACALSPAYSKICVINRHPHHDAAVLDWRAV